MVSSGVVRDYMGFGEAAERLRLARLEQGKTIREIGEAAGIAATTLQNYEARQRTPDLSTLRRWAAALGDVVTFEVRTPLGILR